jgi:hypothetical protein
MEGGGRQEANPKHQRDPIASPLALPPPPIYLRIVTWEAKGR